MRYRNRYEIYQIIDTMNKNQPNQTPTLMFQDTLECWDEFMDADRIRNKCECQNRITCIKICELLQKDETDLATDLIRWLISKSTINERS